MANTLPKSVRLRSYQVGFGDCFLLTLSYESGDRHVLFDFGTVAKPNGAEADTLLEIANHIAETCKHGADPISVVASHRHKDHIDGFARGKNGERAGEVVRMLQPKLVVQPWTEDPALPTDAEGPKLAKGKTGELGVVRRLANMQQVGLLAAREMARSIGRGDRVADRIHFIGADAIKNRDAVESLMTMGPNEYLHFGKKSGLQKLLPGVKVHVLGPPTVRQHAAIVRRSHDAEELWKALALGAGEGATFDHVAEKLESPFAKRDRVDVPVSARWFTRRVQSVRKSQLLQIVTLVDKALNNTSLILLLEIGSLCLLFPGDAEIENWKYALDDSKAKALLRRVQVYKVGHHGSGNATPKSLWELFEHRSEDVHKPGRLTSMLSTMSGKYSGVPSKGLGQVLKRESKHVSTARTTKLYRDLVWVRRRGSWALQTSDQAKSDA